MTVHLKLVSLAEKSSANFPTYKHLSERIMDTNEYTKLALVTESKPETLNFNRGGLLRLLTMLTLASDIADQAKKTMFYGKPLDVDSFREKLGRLADQSQTLASSADHISRPEDTAISLFAPNLRVLHAGIGMFGESGEVIEAIVKQIQTGELDMVNCSEEMGDLLWYGAIFSDETGVPIEQSMEANINKLRLRYGDKFSSNAALNRDLAGERTILEAGLAANDVAAGDKAA